MHNRGSNAFLKQARSNNWQRYIESLPAGLDEENRGKRPSPNRAWDVCILTASDESQAAMMRRQLQWRNEQGLLPAATSFHVIADPSGRRIGSGGATLRILAALQPPESTSDIAALPDDLAQLAADADPSQRILVIHSGGDSRRLPHCSAIGKLFARIPHTLPDGRASTIFDEMLINLSGLAGSAPPGVLVLSGDVLLVFDHLQLSFRRHGVTGVSVAAPAELGLHHGVYVSSDEHHSVHSFLHKASADELYRLKAIDDAGMVQIDTGIVWFDSATVAKLSALTAEPQVAPLLDPASDTVSGAAAINLYGDLLMPLAETTDYQTYLADESDGLATDELRSARKVIWSTMRSTQFTVASLQPAVFVHFGTSEEYWRMVTSDEQLAELCGWTRRAASAPIRTGENAADVVLVNSDIEVVNDLDSTSSAGVNHTALVTDSQAPKLSWQSRIIVAGVRTERPLMVGPDTIVHQLPVAGGYVTRILGMSDDPKQLVDSPKGTFLNRPWSVWLSISGVSPETLWEHVPAEQWNLWNARLFPCVDDREQGLALALPLQNPAGAPQGWIDEWLAAPRLSLAEGFAQADGQRILDDISATEDFVAVRNAEQAVEAQKPASEIATRLGQGGSLILTRRCTLLHSRLSAADEFQRWRSLSVLAEATGDSAYEDAAFAGLARVIEQDVSSRYDALRTNALKETSAARAGTRVRVDAAARIDFGGGWTDTPPYSLERNSYVLNAAISLNGVLPITVEAQWLNEPVILLESRDIGEQYSPRYAGDILDHRNPADPFALAKAALVLKGFVPMDASPNASLASIMRYLPGGIRLTTQTSIPRGSGLGTSSIMAGAVLACLGALSGEQTDDASLFDQVLSVEQMMTTGGGWQDQVGGLVGGVKLVTSEPGVRQRLAVQPAPAESVEQLRSRLFLLYTGQQRLAKNLLRAIMARWVAREPRTVEILRAIGELAIQMDEALRAGDIDAFGELVGRHWIHNKNMDPGCTNDFIDDLFETVSPYIVGGKLAGAGGGGFGILIAHQGVTRDDLESVLRSNYGDTPVAIWPSDIATKGLVIT